MLPAKIEKLPNDSNPLITHRYVTAPSVLVEDRIYVYTIVNNELSDDTQTLFTKHHGSSNEINIISTVDLRNWTDHGTLHIAGEKTIAKWADSLLSPTIVRRRQDGRNRYFLYFVDHDKGIGALVGDSPLGPFYDVLGTPFLPHGSVSCASASRISSLAVLWDDELGKTFLYFECDISNTARSAHSSSLFVVEMNDDMLSIRGAPSIVDLPQAHGSVSISKNCNRYILSYCNGWENDVTTEECNGIGMAKILYAVSESPWGPFCLGGTLLQEPCKICDCYANNHHELFQYKGQWYLAYQALLLESRRERLAGYHCVYMDRVLFSEEGFPMTAIASQHGVQQLCAVDAFSEQRAVMFSSSGAISVNALVRDGQIGESSVCSMREGSWIRISNVAFGERGAGMLRLRYRAQQEQLLRIFEDTFSRKPIIEIELYADENEQMITVTLDTAIYGTHDLVFLFSQKGAELLTWQFFESVLPTRSEMTTLVQGQNPIIPMDFPDPDVIRVGDTYYMVSTTMHFIPGCALLRSYDLIHWELLTHLCPDLGNTAAQRMEAQQNIYGKGMWAASLRYYAGTFYVSFVERDIGKTYLLRSENPQGTWARTELAGYYYDSSLLFDDDGHVYIVHGNTTVRITELDEALTGPKKDGLNRILVDEKDNAFLGYEGAHIQKISGCYYLFLIHSLPSEWKRTQACYRSESLHGVFIGGDVLCDDMGFFEQGIAQGGIVDTPDGDWFAVLFQDRGAAGRLPILVPVHWKDGMPVFGINGQVPKQVTTHSTRPKHRYRPLWTSDIFDVSGDTEWHGEISPLWEWNHQPDPSCWQFLPRRTMLRMSTAKCSNELTDAANILTQRTLFPWCAAEITIDASELENGDRAGLCALQGDYGYIAIERKEQRCFLSVCARSNGMVRELGSIQWRKHEVTLRLEIDFEQLRDKARFFYRDDNTWRPLGEPHSLRFQLDHFTGCRFGLFIMSTKQAGGSAGFTGFRYSTSPDSV